MNDVSPTQQQTSPQSATAQTAARQAVGKVESKTPGRTRVRVKSELRTPQNMEKLRERFGNHPNVNQVAINQRTGSVTFTHSKNKDGGSIFETVLQELELVAEVALEVPAEDDDGGSPEGKLDQQLADLIYRVDYAIYEKTGFQAKGRVVPTTIAGLGVAQILFYGISLETLPGPVLIWIGWDIYHRFGKEPPFPSRQAADERGDSAQPAAAAAAA